MNTSVRRTGKGTGPYCGKNTFDFRKKEFFKIYCHIRAAFVVNQGHWRTRREFSFLFMTGKDIPEAYRQAGTQVLNEKNQDNILLRGTASKETGGHFVKVEPFWNCV